MKSREELRNDYEEALFAIIMDDIIELDGEALLAERERLMQSDEDKVPDDVNERCIAFINSLFEQKEKDRKRLRVRKVWRTILVAAIVMSLCFTTAYATVPTVRMITGELIVAISNISTSLLYGNNTGVSQRDGYSFWFIPNGFELVEEGEEEAHSWCLYQNGESTISINVNYGNTNWEIEVDTEEADSVEQIKTNTFNGVIIKKQNRYHVAVSDEENGNFLQVVFKNVNVEDVYRFLENVHYFENHVALF